jgi:3-oxoacyl-[acyl-carrier protein] reductase
MSLRAATPGSERDEREESGVQALGMEGQVAIVTGAGSGIGRATAHALAAVGVSVVCVDWHGEEAEASAKSIGGSGGTATARTVDVSDAGAVHALVDEVVAEQGRLDIMANVAGIALLAPVLDLEVSDLDRIMSVNFKGVFHGAQAAGRVMAAAGRGAIVNVSSTAIDHPLHGLFAYSAAKAGVVELTKILALELGPVGVRVNAVAPGLIETGMTAQAYTEPDGVLSEEHKANFHRAAAETIPMRRVGQPEEVAQAIVFLASPAASYFTGSILRPNGGATMPW